VALKPCTGCGRRVDTTARTCPGSRRFLPTTPNAVKALAGGVIVALVVLFATAAFQVVGSLVKPAPHPTAAPPTARRPPPAG
jgi:hypothetical protein